MPPAVRRIALFASGVAVGLLTAAAWDGRAPSALTAGLPMNWNAATARFDARLRARFPVGTPIDEVTRGLAAQGFAPAWSEAAGEEGAVPDESAFPCRIAARVFWRRGAGDRLAAIRGRYHEEGCL